MFWCISQKIYFLQKNIWIRMRVIIEPHFSPNLFVCDFSASVITMNGLMILWFNIRSCFVYQCQWLQHREEYISDINRYNRLTCCILRFNFAKVNLQKITFTQLSFSCQLGIINDTQKKSYLWWKDLTYFINGFSLSQSLNPSMSLKLKI